MLMYTCVVCVCSMCVLRSAYAYAVCVCLGEYVYCVCVCAPHWFPFTIPLYYSARFASLLLTFPGGRQATKSAATQNHCAEDDANDGISLTDEQIMVKKQVMEGQNVFITGSLSAPHLARSSSHCF